MNSKKLVVAAVRSVVVVVVVGAVVAAVIADAVAAVCCSYLCRKVVFAVDVCMVDESDFRLA